jgi:Flp pilus assembly protein TadG
MTDDDHISTQQAPHEELVSAATAAVHEPVQEGEEWMEEPEELPRRPRRRLLAPLPLALIAVLLTACGFIGGVLVEKGQGSSSSSPASGGARAARLAALLGGAAATGSSAGSAAAQGAFPGAGGASAGRAVGQVAYLDGSTIYVTGAEGNTVKVSTSAATTVNKTVKSSVGAVHPGETVTVRGNPGTGGSISAETITVGSGSGLAGLLGGGGGSAAASGSGAAAGGQALFGGG